MPPTSRDAAQKLIADLNRLNLPASLLARLLGVGESTTRNWLRGHRDIPEPVAKILAQIVEYQDAKPQPKPQNPTPRD